MPITLFVYFKWQNKGELQVIKRIEVDIAITLYLALLSFGGDGTNGNCHSIYECEVLSDKCMYGLLAIVMCWLTVNEVVFIT